MIQLVLGILIETFIQKSQKIENNDNKYLFFSFFAYFSKTIDFGSVFSAEMNSACKNTLISTFSYYLKTTAIYP